jgi:hypothetical protein
MPTMGTVGAHMANVVGGPLETAVVAVTIIGAVLSYRVRHTNQAVSMIILMTYSDDGEATVLITSSSPRTAVD